MHSLIHIALRCEQVHKSVVIAARNGILFLGSIVIEILLPYRISGPYALYFMYCSSHLF